MERRRTEQERRKDGGMLGARDVFQCAVLDRAEDKSRVCVCTHVRANKTLYVQAIVPWKSHAFIFINNYFFCSKCA